MLGAAIELLGAKYVWGGESPNEGGYDCSGLWYYVAGLLGITFPRVASDQARAVTLIELRHMRPGDFIFFKGTYGDDPEAITHVGVLTEDARMLDSHEPGGVQYTDITTPYWVEHFAFIGRLAS